MAHQLGQPGGRRPRTNDQLEATRRLGGRARALALPNALRHYRAFDLWLRRDGTVAGRVGAGKDTVGDATEIEATVDWLACAEACVPGQTTAKLALPHDETGARRSFDSEAYFAEARGRLPVTDSNWQFSAEIAKDRLEITATPNSSKTRLQQVTFFPLQPGLIANASPQLLTNGEEGYVLVVERDMMMQETPARIEGVLVSASGWGGGHKAVVVNVPVQ